MRQTCGTRYDKPLGGHAMCQRDAGHEVHGEVHESVTLLRLLVIAWDSDRAAEFIPAVREARAFLGLRLTSEKAEKEQADFGDLTKLDATSHSEQMMHLANAMKKVLPPELFQDVLDHLDPLTPFLEYLRAAEL